MSNSKSQKYPKGLIEVNNVSGKCLKHLMSKGKTLTEAEDMILEVLKECKGQLQARQFGFVCELLEMTFMDKELKDININKVLGI